MSTYAFSPFAIPGALTASVVVVFAVVVLLTRYSRTSVAVFGTSVAAAAWQAAWLFMYLAVDARTALAWARVGVAFAPFVAIAAYQFFDSILPPANYRRIVAAAGWLVGAQLAILTLATDALLAGVHRYGWGFHPVFTGTARVLYPIFLVGVLGCVIYEIVRAYRGATGSERSRIRLLAMAFAAGSLACVDLLAMYGLAVYPFGWAAVLICTGIATYTVARYGMVPITPSLAATEIIGTMRDLLLVSDRDGRIRFANNAACAFLGYSREDILGRHLEDLLIPRGAADTAPLQGWVRDREYVFRTKMGQPIELTLSHSPVTHQGEITGAVIIGRDLRERKRYEWEARRAVTLLESTLDSTADGILVIGSDGRILTWNQRFVDLWGIPGEFLSRDEDDHGLIGHLVDQLVDPAEFLNSLAALHEHPEVESVNILEFKDGRRFEQYSIGRYLDNAPLRVWSFRDVTARLAAEEALRDSEARYRLLFEQNAAGVCLASAGGRILSCNSTFAEMVGDTVEELTTRELRDVFERPAALEDIRRQLEGTATVRGVEIEMKRRDGAKVSALANISLVGKADRALLHMTAVDISDRKRAEQQIEYQAYHDALTQLPNRRLFVERLELSMLAARRARGNVAVLFIDLDRFKTINDTLGHSVADALLVEIANRLRSCVRQTDTVARYGGDEFTVILPDLNRPEDAAQVAEKILERVVEPVVTGPHVIEVSASIGVAVFPYDGVDIDTLLRNADDAMYRAKEAGRNTYQLCTEQLKTRASERLSMETRLRKAMREGELVLAYQPLVSMATGLVVGAEALVRWNDPERGVVEPSDFIPIAEETRLIVPLGEWALFAACRQLRQWDEAGLPALRMSINIMARQFQQRDLSTVLRRAIDESGIDPAQLELELREAITMRDVDLTLELLNPLRDAGVTIAIDGFGSATSSLGSLRVLPIDAVKIDPRLLQSVTSNASDAAIVDAVIAVSRTLELRVAAEGVGSRQQFEFLKARGCQEVQGSFLSPAISPDAFRALVAESQPLPV